MSLIIFFGFSLIFTIASSVYVFFVIRHHWRQRQALKRLAPSENS